MQRGRGEKRPTGSLSQEGTASAAPMAQQRGASEKEVATTSFPVALMSTDTRETMGEHIFIKRKGSGETGLDQLLQKKELSLTVARGKGAVAEEGIRSNTPKGLERTG